MTLYHLSQIKKAVSNILCLEIYVEMICILFQSPYFKFIFGKVITSEKENFYEKWREGWPTSHVKEMITLFVLFLKQAITSAQLYVRQLTFETLHLCDKYHICDSIPKLLSSLDEVSYWFLNSKYKIVFKNLLINRFIIVHK